MLHVYSFNLFLRLKPTEAQIVCPLINLFLYVQSNCSVRYYYEELFPHIENRVSPTSTEATRRAFALATLESSVKSLLGQELEENLYIVLVHVHLRFHQHIHVFSCATGHKQARLKS